MNTARPFVINIGAQPDDPIQKQDAWDSINNDLLDDQYFTLTILRETYEVTQLVPRRERSGSGQSYVAERAEIPAVRADVWNQHALLGLCTRRCLTNLRAWITANTPAQVAGQPPVARAVPNKLNLFQIYAAYRLQKCNENAV